MKTANALCMCVAGTLLAGVSHAHIYGKTKPLDTPFGYSLYTYEWHADYPYTSAIVQTAKTNLGVWARYPGPSFFRESVEGTVGPVASGMWYRAKFYSPIYLFAKTISPVYVAADICGITPPREDK